MAMQSVANAQLNQLEIRQPKVEAGQVELEYFGEYHFGQPKRRFAEEEPGSLVLDDNEFDRQRHTIGLSYGLTKWLSVQVAVEAEEERFEDAETLAKARAFDELKVTEMELESTIVLIPTPKAGFGLAALIEHNIAFDRREADQLFLGSALQYAWGSWTATANLYAVRHFGGREELDGTTIRDERWDFQYVGQIKYKMNEAFALALEGYGVVERIGNSGTKSDERELFGDFDRHLLGPVLYYTWGSGNGQPKAKARNGLRTRRAGPSEDGNNAKSSKNGNAGKNDDDNNNNGEEPSYTVGAGVLFGLNDNVADVALKWSMEVEF